MNDHSVQSANFRVPFAGRVRSGHADDLKADYLGIEEPPLEWARHRKKFLQKALEAQARDAREGMACEGIRSGCGMGAASAVWAGLIGRGGANAIAPRFVPPSAFSLPPSACRHPPRPAPYHLPAPRVTLWLRRLGPRTRSSALFHFLAHEIPAHARKRCLQTAD
jgi:hypothetical protein